MTARRLFTCLLGLLLGLAAWPTVAADQVVSRAYFVDASGQMDFAQVQAQAFTPVGKVVNLGFTRSVLWLRLSIDVRDPAVLLCLNVLPASLDEVSFFTPGQAGAAPPPPVVLSPHDLWEHEFRPPSPGEQVAYLRIRATSAMLVMATIEPDNESPDSKTRKNIIMGLVLGSLAATVLCGLVVYTMHRELLVLAGLGGIAASTVVFLFMFGHLHKLVDPGTGLGSNAFLHAAVVANLLLSLLFLHLLLCKTSLPRWGRRLSALMLTPLLAVPPLYLAVDSQLAMKACALTAVACTVVQFGLALFVQIGRRRPSAVPLLIMLLDLFACRLATNQLGLGSTSDWALDLVAWRAAGAPVYFGVVLAILQWERREAMRRSEAEERKTRQALMVLSGRREIQERFVTTLMHEIKTPLSTIQLAAASLSRSKLPLAAQNPRLQNIQHSIDDLNTIVERYMQVDQFDQGVLTIDKQPFDLLVLLNDLLRSIDNERIGVRGSKQCCVCSDFQSVRVIMLNLLSNALKYSAPGSQVWLTIAAGLREGRPGTRLSVSNQIGPAGAPDPTQLFSRYYRSEGARQMAGAGLGLWLAQATARSIDTELRYWQDQERVTFDLWMESA